jgi:hypothetical protein
MQDSRFLSEAFETGDAVSWVKECALSSGWSADEASRLAQCVGDSAATVSSQAYCLSERGPVFVKLDISTSEALLELHHEGAIGDRPCECAAAEAATSRRSSVWLDAQLRTHRLCIARA